MADIVILKIREAEKYLQRADKILREIERDVNDKIEKRGKEELQ